MFVDLRSRGGATWYNAIGLPDSHRLTYVLHGVYTRWIGRQIRKLSIHHAVTNEEYPVDHYFVKAYGCATVFDPTCMVLVDKNLCKKYPKILPH
jgi:hypothetical protein